MRSEEYEDRFAGKPSVGHTADSSLLRKGADKAAPDGAVLERPRPCPFCGSLPAHRFHQCRAIPSCPVMEYWVHEKTGCLMDLFELSKEDIPAWNRRAG